MNRISKLVAVSVCLLCVHFAYAAGNDNSCAPSCPPKDCPKPCVAPKPCPKPCPPKPCAKPCPPVCFERGYPDTQCCLPSAYNEPANYELSPCPWDFWLDASFTYWIAYQEGMDLAQSTVDLTAVAVDIPERTSTLFQDTAWKPGFKVGLGMDFDHDNWSGYAEYTWFRSRTSTSSVAPEGPVGSIDPRWVINNWELNQTGTATSISSNWRLRMDILDAALTRPYYQGTHLIVAPFGGLRATWIRQDLRIHPAIASGTGIIVAEPTYHYKSSSWAIGPRAGFQGEWHLGWGFRFEGDVAGAISFTRYTNISGFVDSDTVGGRARGASYSDYNTLRFNNDMNAGIGWGDYFDCRNYHFDLLLTYDFQIFWNQNMMRVLADNIDEETSVSAHNLYLQGVTLRAQFDF